MKPQNQSTIANIDLEQVAGLALFIIASATVIAGFVYGALKLGGLF